MQLVRREAFYTFLQLAFELAGLGLAWWVAVELRVLLNPWVERSFDYSARTEWAPDAAGILLLWTVSTFWLKPRPAPGQRGLWPALRRSIASSIRITVITIVLTFFSRQFGGPVSRSFVFVFAPVSALAFLGARCAFLWTVRRIVGRWLPHTRVAVLGSRDEAGHYLERITDDGDAVIRGLIVPEECPCGPAQSLPALPVLGTTSQLAEVINRENLDRIILLNGCVPAPDADRCTLISVRMGVRVTCMVGIPAQPIRMSMRYGEAAFELTPVSFTRTQEAVKRLFDVVFSALLLVLLCPVFACIALAIKLTSRGPVLYASPRVGKGGRHFTFLKFRTMRAGSNRASVLGLNEKNGHIFKVRNDPRLTPVGGFLRRYSLDELPQLVNVLRGDMSLVGPRPLPSEDLDPDGMSRAFAAWSEQRARVCPGITGLWQISGRSELPFDEMIRLDGEYIRNWSLALDVKIILDTPRFVLSGRGAY